MTNLPRGSAAHTHFHHGLRLLLSYQHEESPANNGSLPLRMICASYVLIKNHLGVEQSCHNDLESIGHVLMYWNGGERERLRSEHLQKQEVVKKKRKERKNKKAEEGKYNTVPEGVLVYQLDTAQKLVTLVLAPNSSTDMKNLMTEMRVVDAAPSRTSNRRELVRMSCL